MTYIYANLIGTWHCLNDDDNCVMGPNMVSPSQWWEENASLWAPIQRNEADTLYQFPYIMIHYQNADYRIAPCHIQIVAK
ncbi:hypothetical protein ACWOAH_09820 [Vagococcus vulneris]|uniref:Uncharacterized protein n=1 Tax=Vagococcus vulneris TaxID=1977869 RepID=A0A429ZWU8_9ENTE|nr:hypothetical protein [Vagococcus vulneris]RST98286.1 hypothetical protein CBF37_08220 [Vagococcus vulneris]